MLSHPMPTLRYKPTYATLERLRLEVLSRASPAQPGLLASVDSRPVKKSGGWADWMMFLFPTQDRVG